MADPVSQLLALLERQADAGYIGEPVSQLAHALQCANLAVAEGAPEELVLSALLHDIGHACDPDAEVMGGVGVLRHEQIGADFLLATGLVDDVAALVRQHVNAKRYLVQRDARYASKLSAASTTSLAFQGGPMTAVEARAFEAHPAFASILKLRAWDEAAKRVDWEVPVLDHYAAMLRRHLLPLLTPHQHRAWRDDGYLRISNWFAPHEVEATRQAVDEIQGWPDTPLRWMKYHEIGPTGSQLCRIENFVQYHAGLAQLVTGPATLRLLGTLFGEPATLFKEKVNFKLPGGQGFAAHQDAPAFTSFGQDYHITLMYSIDATTTTNGCLEVVGGGHRYGLLPTQPDLTLDRTTVEQLVWTPVETEPGDLVLFDSLLPHRSGDNCTTRPRRALYATYNRASDGNFRDEYFRLKRASFPPDIERQPDTHYPPGVFNVGNPIGDGGIKK